jgi:CBS-domain-containing membrane protein
MTHPLPLLSRLRATLQTVDLRGGGAWRLLAVATLAGVGGVLCVGALEFAAIVSQRPFWQLPFITSIALIMGAPSSEAAQPRALIGGHVVSALAGYIVLWLCGTSEWAAALSVGLAIILMLRLRVFHPPAAVNAFLIVKQGLGFDFLFTVVLTGALLLVAFAFVWHRLGDWGLGLFRRSTAGG